MDPFLQVELEDKSQWKVTGKGLQVARAAGLYGVDNIQPSGKGVIKPGAIIRGDLAKIQIGTYCSIGENVILHPAPFTGAERAGGRKSVFLPMIVSDYVTIGKDTVVKAAKIGSCVEIGSNCVIGERVLISSCCRIMKDTVVPPDTIVPPFAILQGSPGLQVGTLPESATSTLQLAATAALERRQLMTPTETEAELMKLTKCNFITARRTLAEHDCDLDKACEALQGDVF